MQRTIQNLSTNYYILFVFFAAVLLSSCKQEEGYFKVADIEVSFLSNIDNQPRISWKVKSDSANFIQSASRILIADNLDDIENNNGNFWDSDKSTELNQLQVKFTEKNCESGKTYFAKIKVWDNDGTESRWSEIKPFTIPINYPEDWAAKWITYDFHADSALPVFKKQLDIKDKEKIENVRLYIAGPSFYEAYLNNKKIGSNVLDPAQTNFEDYTYYTVYDIEKERIEENNVLGVMIGKGWYNQDIVWRKMTYGQPVFIAQVVVTYKDGTTHKIGTDDTWLWKHGPITFSNIYAGETYDANKEVDDWFSTTHNKAWKTALLSKEHPVELFEQFAEPIKKMEVIATKQILERDSSVYIFDFGQNFSGWLKLKMKGKKNQQITIECYEELDSNGVPDPRTTGIRATKVIQTQTYICRGEGVEEWEPRFTYFGFRYAKVSGLDAKPNKDMLSGIVLYSSLKKTGSFECSEENINKLHQLSDWTVKGNLHGVPTDCPQREKCGWTGDAHALAKTLFYNYDGQLFMNKYVFDLRSSGRKEEKQLTFGKDFHDRKVRIKPKGIPTMIVPGKRTCGTAAADWGTAMTQVPWYLYVWYGEKELLQNFYPDMKVWVEYIKDKELDGIIAHGLGDWCPPGGNRNKDTPVPLSSTIFHIIDLNIMAKTAKVLGFEDDVKYYEGLHKKMCTAFNKQFFDSINYTYGTQTANSMALDANVVPDSLKRKVAAAIVKIFTKIMMASLVLAYLV